MPTFLYDGDCGFCTTTAGWLERRVVGRVRVLPWQRADLAALGVTEQQASEAVQWIAADSPVLAGPDAVGAALRRGRGGWPLVGRVLGARVVRPLAWPAYRWVARHRHQFPGGTPACAIGA